MQIIRDPADTASIADPALLALVQKTIAALSPDGPYDPDVLGYFLIVQPGDTIAMLDAQLGFPILTNKWTDCRFDQPGYTQHFEILEEHAGYFEIVFLLDDSGYGIEVIVPKAIDLPELLAMCNRFAVPAIVP